jgi:hypothetical protein
MSTAPHQPRKKRELTRAVETLKIVYGGEGGIRTLGTLPYTHFPGVRLRPLGHLTSGAQSITTRASADSVSLAFQFLELLHRVFVLVSLSCLSLWSVSLMQDGAGSGWVKTPLPLAFLILRIAVAALPRPQCSWVALCRSLGTLPYTHFPGVRLRPLGHLTSGAQSITTLASADSVSLAFQFLELLRRVFVLVSLTCLSLRSVSLMQDGAGSGWVKTPLPLAFLILRIGVAALPRPQCSWVALCRALGTLPYTHFPGVRLRPLGHLTSGAQSITTLASADSVSLAFQSSAFSGRRDNDLNPE